MTIQQMREKRKALAMALRNLHDKYQNAWKPEHQKEYDRLANEIGEVDAMIDREEEILRVEAAAKIARDHNGAVADRAGVDAERERALYNRFLRNGFQGLSPEEQAELRERQAVVRNEMSTGVPAEGGYTVPRGFGGLLEAMKAFGGMREVASVVQTSTGAPIDFATTDATSEEGEIVGENTEVSRQDFGFGTKSIGAFLYSSKDLAVPFSLLQDNAVDLESHINGRLAQRIHRITNRHFTVGTGVGQPEGIVTAAAEGVVAAEGQVDSITYEDLVDLEHSVDPAYRSSGSCGFMFHDSTLKSLKKLKDTQDRPLWLPGVAQGEPDTILRYRYTINQHMPEMAAGAKSVLFGDFKHYQIRDVMQVMLFRMTDSAFTRRGQVGFLAFSRHDGRLLDVGGAVKYFQNAES